MSGSTFGYYLVLVLYSEARTGSSLYLMSRPSRKGSKPLPIPFTLNLIHLLCSTLAGIYYLKICLFSRYLWLASSSLVGSFPPGIHALYCIYRHNTAAHVLFGKIDCIRKFHHKRNKALKWNEHNLQMFGFDP